MDLFRRCARPLCFIGPHRPEGIGIGIAHADFFFWNTEIMNETQQPAPNAGTDETGERVRGATERAQRAAVEIYARWEAERERTPIDRVVAAEFRSRRYLNSGERRWISEVIYGCVRYLRRQTWLLERLGLPDTAESRVRLWMAAPATPSAEFAPVPAAAPPDVTPDTLAEAVAALPGAESPREQITISLAFTDEMADSLLTLLGAEAGTAAAAFNQQAPITLRVNPLRVGRGHLLKSLPEATPTTYSPWGVELPRRVNVNDLPGYRTGWFEVQEEASQLAALLANPLPGQTLVEVGAGAGGKTLALAALMQNRGSILALDTHEARLEELKRRTERGGVTCVETLRVGADETGKWQPTSSARRTINKVVGKADVVLVDAPCTGSGVLRRSPDAKWREVYLPDLLQLQRTLLAQAALLTAPGGHLIYVTCAFEREQNEEVVEAFLRTDLGGQFVIEPMAPRLLDACDRAAALAVLPPSLRGAKAHRAYPGAEIPGNMAAEAGVTLPFGESENDQSAIEGVLAPLREEVRPSVRLAHLAEGPWLRTWPHLHGLDAFFAACLRRVQ
jgi:16S rRNA (cytosine967-C5)-methyltransferase